MKTVSIWASLLLCSAWTLSDCSQEWKSLPALPSGRREEYYLLNRDGGYKYGFDSGSGIFAKQSGNSANEVEGHYSHQAGGVDVDVRYRAGVAGYVPEVVASPSSQEVWTKGDASYNFSYTSGDSSRSESSDANGNVEGRYEYTNAAGRFDLTYRANDRDGFVVTGGSLAARTGLQEDGLIPIGQIPINGDDNTDGSGSGDDVDSASGDGAYSFAYSSDLSSRAETSDGRGNVQGGYSFRDNAGYHDLAYQSVPESGSESGSKTGFSVVGGSLSQPDGSGDSNQINIYSLLSQPVYVESTPTGFAYSSTHPTDARRSDAQVGSGQDLEIVQKSPHGPGFLVPQPTQEVLVPPIIPQPGSPTTDGAYSFTYSTDDSSRSESGDSRGNLEGNYNAGDHDLAYRASSERNIAPHPAPTLSVVPLAATTPKIEEALTSRSTNADGSYQFAYSSSDGSRSESSDASGMVHGYFSYTNEAGTHDLAYEAGPGIGFIAKGGSLAVPNGLGPPPPPQEEQEPTTLSPNQPRKVQFQTNGVNVINYLPVSENTKSGYILQ